MVGLASPLVFQDKWLEELILGTARSNTYNSSLVKKNFIDNNGGRENVRRTPILRIMQFIHANTQQDLFATVSDSEHIIIAVFPFNPTITRFEREQHQRITDQTKGTVIMVTKANLRIYNKPTLKKLASLPQDRTFFQKFPMCATAGVDTIVLEIIEFTIFQRDLHDLGNIVFRNLQYIYVGQEYQQCFLPKKGKRTDDSDPYDGVVSE